MVLQNLSTPAMLNLRSRGCPVAGCRSLMKGIILGLYEYTHFCKPFITFLLLLSLFFSGCANRPASKVMEATAYCACSSCCSWQRGSWQYFKLDFWNRYVNSGPRSGTPYSGLTASGTVPYEPEEGLFSMDSVYRPWMIPVRLILFPWYLLPQDGTIAADTKYYPFGTRMYIPDYGWGVVEDRGGAIKGPSRIDLYFNSHNEALRWGRKKVHVTIEYAK